MNRIIKFRAWDGDDKEMYFPQVFAILGNGSLSISPLRKCKDGNQSYKPHHILMQFTGLTDKNGTEIYEGDIIEIRNVHKDWEGENGVVVFKDGAFQIEYESKTAFFGWICSFVKIMYDAEKIEIVPDIHIIGNVHEHPDLICT